MYKYLSAFAFALSIFTSINAQVKLDSGLVVYYPFTASYADSSGHAYDAINHNAFFGVDPWGYGNSALVFSGASWLEIPTNTLLSAGHATSISLRFKTTANNPQTLISKSDYTGTSIPKNTQYKIGFHNSGAVSTQALYYSTSHTGACDTLNFVPANNAFSIDTITLGQWYCAVMIFYNGTKQLYLDGALQQNLVMSGPSPASIDSCNTGMLKLGVWWANDPQYFKGTMDEVRIYSRALNVQEVGALCNYNPHNINAAENTNRGSNSLKLYPNPVKSILYIDAPALMQDAKITVMNTLGQAVLCTQYGSSINVSALPPAIYFIEISNSTSNIVQRFVKE